ncbi:unnamed protein product [Staurois parvus]|uniref:Uncharacterized protein n=1 Tax=Staurois parvus TaxID=386267 RepID=A0ABN9CW29_9NEOB|nr:unnamed protein product [Staurois parvus]
MPSAHTTEAGKTARGWIEEQVRSKNNSAESSPVLFAVSGHLLYCVRSLWSSPVLSAVSGHPCAVHSLWSSPVLCPQSLVIPVLSTVSGHPLYNVCSPLVQNFFFPVFCL